ncbi:hypothetical protein SDC9_172857 [bioreactor metagenome]|uniref:Uncharacterized protein n=1 Tax=bioreactor metagenome TaxID=1076179 RepID=A0A645GEX0_9ZZZZ
MDFIALELRRIIRFHCFGLGHFLLVYLADIGLRVQRRLHIDLFFFVCVILALDPVAHFLKRLYHQHDRNGNNRQYKKE